MQRLYVLINDKLDPIYGCVQGGHVVAQWLLDHPDQTWNNNYLIYLKADVMNWREKLGIREIDFSEFYEPDLGNELTAIAVLGNEKLFKNLNLIGKRE